MASELTAALCAFHKDVGAIHKSAQAQYGKFADLATVLSSVIPPLAKNGLVITQVFQPASEGSEPLLITTLRHVSGETVESVLPLVVNNGRNKLHDLGGSITYLRRYALLSLVGLVADVDTDGAFVDEVVEKAKPAPKKTVAKKAAPKQQPAKPVVEKSEDTPLDKDGKAMVQQLLAETWGQEGGQDKIKRLIGEMKLAFPDMAKFDKPLQHVTTEGHVRFIDKFLNDPNV